MTADDEWGDPEPFGEDEDSETLWWTYPDPDCSTQKTTAAKVAAHCADEDGDSPDTPRERPRKGEWRTQKVGCEAEESSSTRW